MATSFVYEGPGSRLILGGQTMLRGIPTQLSGAAAEAAERHPSVHAQGQAAADDPEAGAPAWGTTVDSAMAYVGDDRERASEVLAAEHERGNKARKSLVGQLEQLLEDPDNQDPDAE